MGTLAVDSAQTAGLYGELAVRYNTLRAFVKCVIEQHNTGKSDAACVGGSR